jgi:hypothetical protein
MSAATTRAIKSVLRKAFPTCTFSIRHGHYLEWEDTGPTTAEVNTTLINAGIGEPVPWGDDIRIKIDHERLEYDRYNLAEQEARQRDSERRQAEREAEEARAQEALRLARANGPDLASIPNQYRFQADPPSDPAIFAAFEQLRERAEAEVGFGHDDGGDRERRPSWAPPLILGDELADGCRRLEYLPVDEKPIGRLWAYFATPKKSGRFLRERASKHTLAGITCRGFQFYAGGSRGTTLTLLFEAQREANGEWRFGPTTTRYFGYESPRYKQWESLVRERERLRHEGRAEHAPRIAAITARIEQIDREDAAGAANMRERQRLRQLVRDLGRRRVLNFLGAADAEMQSAARLCGHCCRCWRELTDPISLERGIGPECHHNIIAGIKHYAAEGRRSESIALLVGMPVEFVDTVRSELNQSPVPAEA